MNPKMTPETDEQSLPDITESTAQTQPTTQSSTSTNNGSKKRKKNNKKPHILVQRTLRNPSWCYIHLRHLTPSPTNITKTSSQPPDSLDPVTAHLHLTTALQQFLGLHGNAIRFDILKLEGQDVWIRAQGEDQRAIVAAAGGWVSGRGEGWSVVGWSSWDAAAGAGARDGGRGLFGD